MNEEQKAAAEDPRGEADGQFREAQMGATFLLLKYALRATETIGDRMGMDLTGLQNNCMEDEILCASYARWVSTRLSATSFTPGWMLVFCLGSQIMHTHKMNKASMNEEPRPDFQHAQPWTDPQPPRSPGPDVYFREYPPESHTEPGAPADYNEGDDDLDESLYEYQSMDHPDEAPESPPPPVQVVTAPRPTRRRATTTKATKRKSTTLPSTTTRKKRAPRTATTKRSTKTISVTDFLDRMADEGPDEDSSSDGGEQL